MRPGIHLLVALAVFSLAAPAAAQKKVKVVFHVMSQCPYAVQAENGFLPVYKKLRRHVDWRLEYIGTDKNGQLESMHGHSEVQGDMLQLCARKVSTRGWTTFLDCQNQSWRKIPANWKACANMAGINVGKMRRCYQGTKGQDLLRRSFLRSKAARAHGSPTIMINGKAHSGGRSERDFTAAVCRAMTHRRKPAVCRQIPPEPVVMATALSDRRCPKCDKRIAEVERIMKKRFFPKLQVTRLDWSSPKAKKLYRILGLSSLPTMVFDHNADRASKFNAIKRFMKQHGRYWVLTGIGVTHDPNKEICNNKVDDTGNGKVDCADAQCSQDMLCRKRVPRKLDLFIMSQCPYGVRAVNSLKEVLPHFRGRLRLDIHYIATKTASGFSALHGRSEVEENIRQLCAKKHYGKRNRYLSYLWCRYTGNAWRSDDWKPCATGGISPLVIERCANGAEGRALLEQDIKLAKGLQISASPTWLTNNRHKFNGISPRQIWTGVCKRNGRGARRPSLAARPRPILPRAAAVPRPAARPPAGAVRRRQAAARSASRSATRCWTATSDASRPKSPPPPGPCCCRRSGPGAYPGARRRPPPRGAGPCRRPAPPWATR